MVCDTVAQADFSFEKYWEKAKQKTIKF